MIGINTNLLTLTILILLIILQTKGFPMEKMVTFIKSNRLLHKRVERAKYKANWGESSLEIERQFNQYYKCLDKRVQQITQKGHHIKAVIAMFGQNLELKCHVCFRPDQKEKHIEWQHVTKEDSTVRVIESEGRYEITRKKTLLIHDVEIEDVGTFMCLYRGDYEDIYQVDVLRREKRRMYEEGEEVLEPQLLTDNNLELFTTWSGWSACNNCGKPGQRRKIGLCMVKKIDPEEPIEPKDYPMMELYPEGIPCRATALPHFIANKEEIRDRPSETILDTCTIPCPTIPPVVTITDSSGKVIEVIEEGHYSIKSPPKLPPMIRRIMRYEDAGIHLVLQCPKIKSSEMVRWTRNERVINSMTIKQQTRGRVWIDNVNRLHIGKLLMTDTDMYNCFVRKRHVANMKIVVVQPFNESLKNYISYAGFVLTGVLILIVLIFVCRHRQVKRF